MTAPPPTFIDAYLAGHATAADIDDWVERWHITGSGSLDDFLGFTPDEGAQWAQDPSVLPAILLAHAGHIPLAPVSIGFTSGLVYCKRCGRLLSSPAKGSSVSAARPCSTVPVELR